jgi:hypothetical protein
LTDENGFGMAVIKTDNEDDAVEIMEEDPAVRSGVMQARLYPFQVLLH